MPATDATFAASRSERLGWRGGRTIRRSGATFNQKQVPSHLVELQRRDATHTVAHFDIVTRAVVDGLGSSQDCWTAKAAAMSPPGCPWSNQLLDWRRPIRTATANDLP